MDYIKITVITVCFNAEDTIEQTIQSVLGQNYPELEYIIVDGLSTDATMKIVNKYFCDTMRVVSESDKGISDAFNKGIGMATGDIIGLINADDQLNTGALARVNKAYQESGADIIYGDTITIDAANNLRMYKKAGKLEELKYSMPFIHQSAFVKKSAYEKLTGGV